MEEMRRKTTLLGVKTQVTVQSTTTTTVLAS